jgi:D-amino peptidase
VKVFISSDIEGTAGIVDWGQVLQGSHEYELGRSLLEAEVNAAIAGALEGGATEIVVNDSHHTMQNLRPDRLAGRASLVSGAHKPLYMMEGLDASFGCAFLVSYHGSISAEHATLSHTYNPGAIWHVELNGAVVGESAINMLVARHHGVPVALVTGDDATAAETSRFAPGVEAVVVKRSITRFAAESVHPEVARELIRAGARAAVERAATLAPPAIELPARLDVTLLTADLAEMATWLRGVERTGTREIAIVDDDPLRLYRTFVTLIALTRSLVEPR